MGMVAAAAAAAAVAAAGGNTTPACPVFSFPATERDKDALPMALNIQGKGIHQ